MKDWKERQMQPGTRVSEDPRDAANVTPYLSQREREILTLVAEGRTDNQIAIQLCLSAKTVSWYVKQIRARLEARSRAHAVALALQHGLLSGPSIPVQEP
jgi:DNA-binding CsgD family transcriptional regulator